MKLKVGNWLAGFGIIGVLATIALVFGAIGLSLYGIYLAFSASIVLGILVLFLEPAPFVIGFVKVFAGIDIALRIVEFFSK